MNNKLLQIAINSIEIKSKAISHIMEITCYSLGLFSLIHPGCTVNDRSYR